MLREHEFGEVVKQRIDIRVKFPTFTYQKTTMQTVTVKINNSHALKLLEELEALNLIQVIKQSVKKEKGKKLSERMAGSISSEQATKLRDELKEMRNE